MTAVQTSSAKDPALLPNLDLKWSLMLRVVAVALMCFLVAAMLALLGTFRVIRAGNENVADIFAKQLEMQLLRIDSNIGVSWQFPDWDSLTEHLQSPGQCVKYIKPDGSLGRSSCIGFDRSIGTTSAWLSAMNIGIPVGRVDVARPISYRGKAYGVLRVTTEPAAVLDRVWKDVSGLLGLTMLVVTAICLLQYIAISSALRPTKDVLDGLDRLAQGDLSCRLRNFRLIELQRISDVFNMLAANLDRTTRERAALASKLVDGQEQERQHLARELHDELAQALSAMNAVAASIKTTAQAECFALVPEADRLSQMSMSAMKTLRSTMRSLRPPEIDDLGLAASLAALARTQEKCSEGTLTISLEIDEDLRCLPSIAASHVYRIVQEGLTNIGKHAHADFARVALGFQQELAGHHWLTLTIEDNGRGTADRCQGKESGGLGLIGIRERVMALGGQLDIVDSESRGFRLHAMIPFERCMELPA